MTRQTHAWACLSVSSLFVLLVAVPGLAQQFSSSSTGASDSVCYVNTTLHFIVDTSQSWDNVASSMKASLDALGDNNGALLNFEDYRITTWMFYANDTQHFATIQDLTNAFNVPVTQADSLVGNVRITDPSQQHNDWGYMLDTLAVAVNQADSNGIVIILGDQDELCDGRHMPESKYAPFDNTVRDATIPGIVAAAQAKNVHISFFYVFIEPAYLDPNGCPDDPNAIGNRAYPMSIISGIASDTGGVFEFNATVYSDMAEIIKEAGKRPAVCDDDCVADPSLGVIVDTSGSTVPLRAQMMDLFELLSSAATTGTLQPFNDYFLSTWANPANSPLEYATFVDLAAAMQDSANYINNRPGLDPNPSTQHNDWLYLVDTLEVMVNKVGAGGYIVTIADQEQECDVYRYGTPPPTWYSDRLQHVINVAIEKRISFSYFVFADGSDGAHTYTNPPDCSATIRAPVSSRMDAMAAILNGEALFDLPMSTAGEIHYASQTIAASVVHQSLRTSCTNCTVNATLAMVVDTSASADPLKPDLRNFFTQLAAINGSLHSFKGGVKLNTFAYADSVVFTFADVIELDTFIHTYVPVDPLAALRAQMDPTHTHDDWAYMLESLEVMVPQTGAYGIIIILGDDNQICDAGAFGHNTSEYAYIVAQAQQQHIKIHYFAFATANHWCTAAQMVPGHALATALATATSGSVYFGSNETLVANELHDQVLPVIVTAAERPECAQVCPADSVWAGDKCIATNPCAVRPCQNGGTCIPEMYTADFTCECSGTYGPLCQYPCVPHSTPQNLSHALGIVVDTSDSNRYNLDSMLAAVTQMMIVPAYFDEYLLSTWAYLPPHLVKVFGSSSDLLVEMGTPEAGLNHRTEQDSGLATHNDWKYMLDSLEAILPMMGDNGVLVILEDFEQVCDANQAARMVNGIPRYPMNPDLARVDALNAEANAHNIKIFFFTFPSSDYGWCNAAQKQVGLDAAAQLIAGTEGLLADVPSYMSPDTLATVRAALANVVALEAGAEYCDCPAGLMLQNNLCA